MSKKIVNPALIIGIGGTGTKSLFETKISLIKRYGEVPSCIKLLCFDTDIPEMESISKEIIYMKKGSDKAVTEVIHFDKSEMISIPIENPTSTKRHDHIKKWLDPDIAKGLQPSVKGASQVRQKGRFAFFENYSLKNLSGRIDSALTEINSYVETDDQDYQIIGSPKIHMVFSPNGGTGGGTFLDFAITIQHITKGKTPLSAWMLLPSFFDGFDACTRVHQNAYAALMEIDHMMGVDATENRPWSNADPDHPYTISYDGATDITLGPDLSLFENIFVFDKKMKNSKEITEIGEMYTRIGDIIYEFISGAGDQIFERMSSNFATDFDSPSNDLNGNKRRNYFSIGLGHISLDRALIKEFTTLDIIEKMITTYSSAIPFSTSDEVINFLDESQLNELGNNENDDIINSLFPPSALKYDTVGSLYPPEFNKGCNVQASSLGTTFLAKWDTKITKTTDENFVIKEESFGKAIEEKIRGILKKDGGVNNSLQFLNFLQGQFEVMKNEMKTEAATHKMSMVNHKNTLLDQQELIKNEEHSISIDFWNKEEKIKEECENYASKIELLLKENMNVIRKEAAERLLLKFIGTIAEKTMLLNAKSDLLQSINVSLGQEDRKAMSYHNKKANYVTDLTHKASESISLSSERLTGIISDFHFEEHMSDAEITSEDLKNKFREYVSNLEEIGSINDMTVEEVMSSSDEADIKDRLEFLETSSSPCALIDNGFTLDTAVAKVNNIGFVTTEVTEVSVINDKKNFLSWDLKKDRLVPSGDPERITMVQCEGPFPINALTALKKSKVLYDVNEARVTHRIFSHSDTFFSKNAQDLYKDDSIENAQIYFGIGSALNLIECTSSKYIIRFKGEQIDLSEPGSQNRKDRNLAFDFFKKEEKYVNYVKSEYEIELRRDPMNLSKMLLNHFDTIHDPMVLKKQRTSCSRDEIKYIRMERLAVANYALDNAYLNLTSYMQRTDENGTITKKYTERELRNEGLNVGG